MIQSPSILTSITMLKLMVVIYMINKTHILNNLIIMEFTVMAISLMVFKAMNSLSMEMYILFFLLILMITESILGLSILILMIRTHSNDYLKSSTVVTA